jgi:hypothetical protein
MSQIIEMPLGEYIKHLEDIIVALREGCQNPACPNDHKIDIAIFKGGPFCSDNCRKALDLDPAPQVRH